ncbi:hypothetical protein BDR26DRAFT_855614 [Obelidium mucronatum]|nr:hypothetical protein BDR26DRAFT_855614 [Obelidium mucronatum]
MTWQNLKGGPGANLDAPALEQSEINERFICVLCGYLLVCLLFSANLALALQRHWVIRFARSLSRNAVLAVYFSGLVAFSLFLAAFILAVQVSCVGTGGMNLRFGRPFALPGNPKNLVVKGLFLAGMCYFPLVIALIVALYASSYRRVSVLVQENYQMQLGELDDAMDDEDRAASISSSTNKQKRTVLLRCTLMSIGCLLFYAPTIVSIFVDRLSPLGSTTSSSTNSNSTTSAPKNGTLGATISKFCPTFNPNEAKVESSWQYPVTTILPALDVIWTPLLILWVQKVHRNVYTKFLRDSWNSFLASIRRDS